MNRFYYGAKRWALLGWRKGVVYPVCRKLYRDAGPDIRRTLLIAGAGRSGTTWLAELLAARLPCRILFEPFNPRKVSAFSGFQYFHYQRTGTDSPVLESFCHDLLTGRLRDPWIDRQVDCLRPRYRIIKEIRANLFLRWMKDRFPQLPLLFILRHPCSVVASRLQLHWDTDRDIEPFLSQPELLEDFLSDKLDLIRGCRSDAEKHAVVWAVSNLIPLRQFEPSDLPIVYYENLISQPEVELPRIFDASGLYYDEGVLEEVGRPSATTIASSSVITGQDRLARWKQDLDKQQIDDVLRVVDAFGLGHLYSESGLPSSGF